MDTIDSLGMVKLVPDIPPAPPATFKSNYTVKSKGQHDVSFDTLDSALVLLKAHPIDTHIEVTATVDDAVKLVQSIKTRRVTLYMVVSHYAPDTRNPASGNGWRAYGHIKVTRGALLRFIQEAYGCKSMNGRAMVCMSLYDNCLFIGQGS